MNKVTRLRPTSVAGGVFTPLRRLFVPRMGQLSRMLFREHTGANIPNILNLLPDSNLTLNDGRHFAANDIRVAVFIFRAEDQVRTTSRQAMKRYGFSVEVA